MIQTSLSYSYDYWLVLLSLLVAVFASYATFHLVTRVVAASNPRARTAWLVTGAFSMGGRIWSMHFIAMLSVSMAAPPQSVQSTVRPPSEYVIFIVTVPSLSSQGRTRNARAPDLCMGSEAAIS